MRGRPANIIPSERMTLWLPADLRARIDLHLFSEVEGRIPRGAYTEFFSSLAREYIAQLDKVK